MGLYLCSYATEDFKSAQEFQRRVALDLGFAGVFMFGPELLSEDFKRENKETLCYLRGSGYWVWKPEIILQTIKLVKPNDTIMYLDAGVLPCSDSVIYEELSKDGKINLWTEPTSELPINFKWIDLNVARHFALGESDLDSPHYLGGIICFKPSEANSNTIREWHNLCKAPYLLRPDSFSNYKPSPNLIWHRHDQSLLNILVLKQRTTFNLHDISRYPHYENFFSRLFLIHRRGGISNNFQLNVFLAFRKVKRLITRVLPLQFLPYINFYFMNRSRRSTTSLSELKSHLKR